MPYRNLNDKSIELARGLVEIRRLPNSSPHKTVEMLLAAIDRCLDEKTRDRNFAARLNMVPHIYLAAPGPRANNRAKQGDTPAAPILTPPPSQPTAALGPEKPCWWNSSPDHPLAFEARIMKLGTS